MLLEKPRSPKAGKWTPPEREDNGYVGTVANSITEKILTWCWTCRCSEQRVRGALHPDSFGRLFRDALLKKLYELVEALQRDLWTSDLSTTTESLSIRAIGTWEGGP